MQTLNQKRGISKKIKKSHLLIIGSFLVFLGGTVLFSNHLLVIKNHVYSDMMLLISDNVIEQEEIILDIPLSEDLSVDSPLPNDENNSVDSSVSEKPKPPVINYDKYLGVLEIPRISLKRGFYGLDSPYNNIQDNVTMVSGSVMPDVTNGNLILMAHSGDSYISYFAYLHKLKIGSDIYVTYNKTKYHYRLVNIYDVLKNGTVSIVRNYDKTTLTLITCTENDSTKQTVYIAELV